MREEQIDPRYEKLVALLYGELPEVEARELRRQMDEDPGLRAEFEGLAAARSFLGAWEVPGVAPHFVFVAEADEPRPRPARATTVLSRLRDRFRGFAVATPWAVAATAVVVAVLGWNDFRIDRTEGGLAFRFGDPPAAPDQSAERLPLLSGNDAGQLPPSGSIPVGTLEAGRQANTTVPVDADGYMTRAEFDNYSSGIARTMVALLNEYSRRRDQELTGLLQDAFGRFSDRQTTDYADLMGRIDALQQGVSLQSSVTDSRLDYLLRTGAQGPLTPPGAAADSIPVQEGVR